MWRHARRAIDGGILVGWMAILWIVAALAASGNVGERVLGLQPYPWLDRDDGAATAEVEPSGEEEHDYRPEHHLRAWLDARYGGDDPPPLADLLNAWRPARGEARWNRPDSVPLLADLQLGDRLYADLCALEADVTPTLPAALQSLHTMCTRIGGCRDLQPSPEATDAGLWDAPVEWRAAWAATGAEERLEHLCEHHLCTAMADRLVAIANVSPKYGTAFETFELEHVFDAPSQEEHGAACAVLCALWPDTFAGWFLALEAAAGVRDAKADNRRIQAHILEMAHETYGALFSATADALEGLAEDDSLPLAEATVASIVPDNLSAAGSEEGGDEATPLVLEQAPLPASVVAWVERGRDHAAEVRRQERFFDLFVLILAIGGLGSLIYLVRDYVAAVGPPPLAAVLLRPVLGVFLALAMFTLYVLGHSVVSTSDMTEVKAEPLLLLAFASGLLAEEVYALVHRRARSVLAAAEQARGAPPPPSPIEAPALGPGSGPAWLLRPVKGALLLAWIVLLGAVAYLDFGGTLAADFMRSGGGIDLAALVRVDPDEPEPDASVAAGRELGPGQVLARVLAARTDPDGGQPPPVAETLNGLRPGTDPAWWSTSNPVWMRAHDARTTLKRSRKAFSGASSLEAGPGAGLRAVGVSPEAVTTFLELRTAFGAWVGWDTEESGRADLETEVARAQAEAVAAAELLYANVADALEALARPDATGDIALTRSALVPYEMGRYDGDDAAIDLPPVVVSWVQRQRARAIERDQREGFVRLFIVLLVLGGLGSLIFLVWDLMKAEGGERLSAYVFRPVLGMYLALGMFIVDMLVHAAISEGDPLTVRHESLFAIALASGLLAERAYALLREKVRGALEEEA